jgi:hypothetical protein
MSEVPPTPQPMPEFPQPAGPGERTEARVGLDVARINPANLETSQPWVADARVDSDPAIGMASPPVESYIRLPNTGIANVPKGSYLSASGRAAAPNSSDNKWSTNGVAPQPNTIDQAAFAQPLFPRSRNYGAVAARASIPEGKAGEQLVRGNPDAAVPSSAVPDHVGEINWGSQTPVHEPLIEATVSEQPTPALASVKAVGQAPVKPVGRAQVSERNPGDQPVNGSVAIVEAEPRAPGRVRASKLLGRLAGKVVSAPRDFLLKHAATAGRVARAVRPNDPEVGYNQLDDLSGKHDANS